MEVSIVIPTCNRRQRLLSLLADLSRSTHPIREVLIVDSSDDKLRPDDYADFASAPVHYIESARKSVCVQRNVGIQRARGDWVFLCDDDIEVPPDYVAKLAEHVRAHPEAGAVSGLCFEKNEAGWKSEFPAPSARGLLWRYLFQLGVWGEIQPGGPLMDWIAARYRRRGNHISRAGFPVLVDFSGPYFRTPIYALGASIVRRDWLLDSPFDEHLDPHGMGDNYGVAIGFPPEGIHVVTGASVRHHREPAHRLDDAEAYAGRLMALHYFIRSHAELTRMNVQERFFLWSLLGQIVFHAGTRNRRFASAAASTFYTVIRGRNPLLARRDAAN
jgi:glycosyltransferase involved in cell wall biosynthesis